MMRNLLNKLTIFFALFAGIMQYAQKTVPPPPPPNSTGPGAPDIPTQPIDMYVVWLAFTAIALIVYFAKNRMKKIV